MAEGFGDNLAAKVMEKVTHYVNIRDGMVLSQQDVSLNDDPNNDNILTINSTVGSFRLTQASRLTAKAIATTKLHGVVIDWGCGGGLLALLAASQPKVKRVIGLDYEAQNIYTCIQNANLNGLEHKTEFYRSDSFQPLDEEEKFACSSLQGHVDFVIANPPASSDDDGFSFRRRILNEAIPFLKPNSQILIQALSYYGPHRFTQATKAASDLWRRSKDNNIPMKLQYEGVIKSSKWMELGSGPGGYDLKEQLQQYCREEKRGGMRYFCGYRRGLDESKSPLEMQFSALEAMNFWEKEGKTPLCQWHVHSIRWLRKD